MSNPFVFIDSEPPQVLQKNKYIEGILHFAGTGNPEANLMFVALSPLDEERDKRTSPSMLMKGSVSNVFRRACLRSGLKDDDYYYTTLCKFVLPHRKPFKVKIDEINWSSHSLKDEIKRVKPKLIVCLGKQTFDQLSGIKCTERDARGGFFHCPEYDCMLYLMDRITVPHYKPHLMERFVIDLKEIKKFLDETKGIAVPKIPTNYRTIATATELWELLNMFKDQGFNDISVDCEWAGDTYLDGKLRSIQFCWAPGEAAYIQFRDETGAWVFDVDLDAVKELMKPLHDVKFMGHNLCADFVWMKHVLGIPVYKKASFDTMHAQMVLNEYADLKLERLAVKYTDLGRYDMELTMWKREHGLGGEGYGRIPDSILIPYACKDVDTVIRARAELERELEQQELEDYYYNINLPFVTDGFVEMSMTGLPINIGVLDVMRDTYAENYEKLEVDFVKELAKQAAGILMTKLFEINSTTGLECYQTLLRYKDELNDFDMAYNVFKQFVGIQNLKRMDPVFRHWWGAGEFNIRSKPQMVRWLFGVCGFEPVKTTKVDNIQIPWEKVEKLPEEHRKQYQPSTDKQTLLMLAENDRVVGRVVELNAVGNIIKGFLKGRDASGKEHGLHKWVQSDGRLHPNFACTETGRPRSWNPNVLNYPKHVTKPIEAAFARLDQNKPDSLRSCVEAPEGWCFVDADLDVAEVLSLAYIAGDEDMIHMCLSEDPSFYTVDKDKAEEAGIATFEQKGEYTVRSELLTGNLEAIILKDDDGNFIRPRRDMHWEMAEEMNQKPREELDEIVRMAGKVGMFSIPYGAKGPLLERQIEMLSGGKPEEGTGEKLIEAYETKFKNAAAFLRRQERIVEDPGY
jgi:uracil-DNA glycosylase family 4